MEKTKFMSGEEVIRLFRPPSMPADHPHDPNNDLRYQSVPKDQLPNSECLADVVDRLVPYWEGALSEDLATNGTVLVAAHGNSLRALVKHLDGISDHDILDLNIPTGAPNCLRAGLNSETTRIARSIGTLFALKFNR